MTGRRRFKPKRRPLVPVATYPFEWRTWVAINAWCHEPDHPKFARYGGRGVVVVDRWRESFANFIQDMGGYGIRPRGTVLARRDRSGPFGPRNCYWKPRAAHTTDTRAELPALARRPLDSLSDAAPQLKKDRRV